MIPLVLIAFLLVLGIALMVMDAAIEHAEPGYEDNFGFHRLSPGESVPAEPDFTLLDQREGACCPLNLSPSLRAMGRAAFTTDRRENV